MEQQDAVIENKVRDYFTAFGNKDDQTLCKMFDSDIHLIDSHVNCRGIVEVLQANETIFANCLRITPIIDDILVDGNDVCAILDIEIMTESNDPTKDYAENHVTLKVVDLIRFNDEGLITKISAYKQ
jgi:ketosteroid isomerase-like protein